MKVVNRTKTVGGLTVCWWLAPLLSVASLAAPSSDTRLVDAVEKRDKQAVRYLIAQHVDANSPQGDGATALAWAAHWNDLETAELLISAGAKVDAANDLGVTPLWEACYNGSTAMVERLSKAGANPNAILTGTGETALMQCARTGDADSVKSLLARGADVNSRELRKGQTALMWALEEGHSKVAQALIEHGADIHAKSKGGFTPLLFAARQGDVESARLLLKNGADANEVAPLGLNALLLATDSGRQAFAIFLLENGANPNAADPNGLTALHYSLRKGITILSFADRAQSYKYADADAYIFRPNMQELVKALLAHGANPNPRILKGTKRSARLATVDYNELALTGATPFLLASATGDVGSMRALLAKGADPALGTYDGVTPLMAAAGVGRSGLWDRTLEEETESLEAVKLLVDLGADLNATNNDGVTAMHGAAYTGANQIVQFLADRGARLDMKDRLGQTPLSRAEGDPNGLVDDHQRNAHPKTAELIRKLGGDPMARGRAFVQQRQ